MFCIKCGVQLADTEKSCPLCGTRVYHPDLPQKETRPLYPVGRIPKQKPTNKSFCGALIILFLIPVLITCLADLQFDGHLDWAGYVAGALLLGYVIFALPLWFKRPNPVIFVPCGFAAAILYLLYINVATGGNWFLSFAFPVSGALTILVTAVVTLLYYVKKGTLYVLGGAFMALGGLCLLAEFLLVHTFPLSFVGWSMYPLIVLILLGGWLVYLAINRTARETMERKFFF